MTIQEAIEQLLPLKEAKFTEGSCTFPMISTPLQVEALDLAIKALMAYRDCRHCIHNIKVGNMRGCELGTCDFEDTRGKEE